jgi:uncharacterized protein involved in exopolysaccharide biosynthesis
MDSKEQLKAAYANLKAEVEAMDAQAAPIISEGKALQAQIEPLLAKQREISAKLKAIRPVDYAEKRKLLGALATAMGGKSLKAEPGVFKG